MLKKKYISLTAYDKPRLLKTNEKSFKASNVYLIFYWNHKERDNLITIINIL